MMRDPRLAPVADLYPFDSHFLDIDGHRMHYVDEGAGHALVLVHGNPTWSFYFRDLIKELRDRYRVIALDHIGCGMSEKPRTYPYTLSTHIRNLGRLLDHLQLSEVTLAGHDWGGAIACGWAVENSERVRRLVIFNTAAFPGGPTPFRIRVCGWPILGGLAVRGLNLFVRASFWMGCRRHERMTRKVRRGYLLPYDSYAHRVAVLRFVRDIPSNPSVESHSVVQSLEAGLPRLADRPMLILWGMQDFCFTPAFLDQWTARFPHAEVHRFLDAGHYVVEDAAERIVPLLGDFLGRD